MAHKAETILIYPITIEMDCQSDLIEFRKAWNKMF